MTAAKFREVYEVALRAAVEAPLNGKPAPWVVKYYESTS